MMDIIKEKPILKEDEFYSVFHYYNAKFDYPLHNHDEYEINFVYNTTGQRIVGDSKEEFSDIDLVLLGPNLPHFWKAPTQKKTEVLTIYFSLDTFNTLIINKKGFSPIKEMLQRSNRGIKFSKETTFQVKDMMYKLLKLKEFEGAIHFFTFLHDLAISEDQELLASTTYDLGDVVSGYKSRRIDYACKYIKDNFHDQISLKSLAADIGMSETSFSHFFKKRTKRNFVNYLNEVRIGQATKLLIETTHNISEISYMCGFNNLSNFNRKFKEYKMQTPKEFRTTLTKLHSENLVNMLN